MSLHDELLRRFPRLSALPPGSYVVGGAIRDLVLGLEPADVDIACLDARAGAAAIGPRQIRLGTEEHLSAWRVVRDGHMYDVAALLDGAIGPDLARRDFTVNAMAVALDDGAFLDPHGGKTDLTSRIIRMIDPSNFDDDPLRCLKGVRMAVRFDFEIETATLDAIRERAGSITSVAAERVTYELEVIFSSGRFRKAVELLRQTGLDVPLFDRAIEAQFHADDVSLAGAMALLVADPKAHGRRWKWSVELIREAIALRQLLSAEGDRRIALYDAGEKVARQLPPLLRAVRRVSAVEMPDFTIRALLSGEEISQVTGVSAGPELGRAKRALLEAQIRGEIAAKDDAVKFVRAAISSARR